MAHDFTAVIERDEDWCIAYCPELPGAHGQGRTLEEVKHSQSEAIELILDVRRQQQAVAV